MDEKRRSRIERMQKQRNRSNQRKRPKGPSKPKEAPPPKVEEPKEEPKVEERKPGDKGWACPFPGCGGLMLVVDVKKYHKENGEEWRLRKRRCKTCRRSKVYHEQAAPA